MKLSLLPTIFAACCGIFILGCTTHKVEVQPVVTEHEVKPIHITLDVNLKVANEIKQELLDDSGAAPNSQNGQKAQIRERRRERRDVIQDLKKRGIVGEHSNGLLVYRVRGNEQGEVVKAENTDRETWYKIVAEENGMLAQDVAAERARASLMFSPAGTYVMKDGAWHQITEAEEEAAKAERQKMREEMKKQREAANK